MTAQFSQFTETLEVEAAFLVLARAKELKAQGKDVVELEIGDSPFDTTPAAIAAGIAAIQDGQTRYCPSPGLPDVRQSMADAVRSEFGIPAQGENIVVGPGAKIFEQLFCEAFLNPGDGVLVFSPHFPTYTANIQRRQARPVLTPLCESQQFRPDIDAVEAFLNDDPSPRAIFLNTPHNPTGGVATKEDLRDLADLVRGKDIAVFCDEPYCHMVWQGRHHSLLAEPDMLEQCVATYTFSKSYSMSGWRLGFCVSSARVSHMIGQLVNTTLSCTPPMIQRAGQAALHYDSDSRDDAMQHFKRKVELLSHGLEQIPGISVLDPLATFYVFANVKTVCERLRVTSHGLATWFLEDADPDFGIACLGGECFGPAGSGFLRFSCAEADERLTQAVDFLKRQLANVKTLDDFLQKRPEFRA
ncbi:MAG: pyridoxal phosphate-dependent aminotransferase [Planctomycetaceae bacterium]